VIAPRGELDMNVVGRLDAAFEEALAAGYRRIVVDLRGLSFMDSTGLHSVLGMQRSTARDGVDFALVPGGDAVQHVFELTQTVDVLPFVDPGELELD
jgi:anti-anti-sigma factor